MSEALSSASPALTETPDNAESTAPLQTPIATSSVSAMETFDPAGYPPATFAVETREPIPEATPRVTPMAGKTEHVERTLTALGQKLTIKADVVMPLSSQLKRYQASLKKQTSEQQITKQKDFFFGTGVQLTPADPAFINRFYQNGTIYLLSPDNRQALLLVNQGVGDVLSVAFVNEGPWKYQIDREDTKTMQRQALSLLDMMFPDESVSPVPYSITGPSGEDDPPITEIRFAQSLDGLPIACESPADVGVSLPRPSLDIMIATKEWSHTSFYSTRLLAGDISSISVHYLYDIDESVGSTEVIPFNRLLDIMQEKTSFVSMITPDCKQPVFDTVRLVYDVDRYAKTSENGSFVLKPYWEFARYVGNTLYTYRYDADPAAYQ